MREVTVTQAVNRQCRITLLGYTGNPCVGVLIISIRVAQARPAELIIRDLMNQQLNRANPASNSDLGYTVSGADLECPAGRLHRVGPVIT